MKNNTHLANDLLFKNNRSLVSMSKLCLKNLGFLKQIHEGAANEEIYQRAFNSYLKIDDSICKNNLLREEVASDFKESLEQLKEIGNRLREFYKYYMSCFASSFHDIASSVRVVSVTFDRVSLLIEDLYTSTNNSGNNPNHYIVTNHEESKTAR